MEYVIYTNRNDSHSTIHIKGCFQIKKRGGEHKYNQGDYFECSTIEEAEEYCKEKEPENKGEIIHCSSCFK